MSISKKKYELSVWKETLEKEGFKTEIKEAVIGAHDMTYLGRATAIKLITKVNGTHNLTFQMPDKYFDSEKGKYIHNEFVDYLFNEKKIKLYYKDKWYEFYVKSTEESKNYKSYMINYSCTDAFIDELSRNGYGITFDSELYNNVEEIGVFTEEILEDSIWEYDASLNIGDFTEYSEERFFRIPVSLFTHINGYKLEYDCGSDHQITNIYTGQSRNMEIGDDLARQEKYFWDNGSYDNGFQLTENIILDIPNDGYIYVPYTSLNFCYITTSDKETLIATEEAAEYDDGMIKSYALAPNTIDPSALIQFIAIPEGEIVNIDENGLLLNKNFTYVMTIKQWNELVSTPSDSWYSFEDVNKKEIETSNFDSLHGNKIVGYKGYLDAINQEDVYFCKKISITDRTECNISEEIDQYVKVYQNKSEEYSNMYTSEDWCGGTDNYRVCSKTDTRQIIPQLSRNFLTNATEISSADGWEIMNLYTGSDLTVSSAQLSAFSLMDEENKILIKQYLKFIPTNVSESEITSSMNTFINFGIIGQEKNIEKGRIYCIGFEFDTEDISLDVSKVSVKIGKGTLISNGEYSIDDTEIGAIDIPLNRIIRQDQTSGYILFKPTQTIENPYFTITSSIELHINKVYLFEAYTKGIDFFDNGAFKYSGRELFDKYVPNKSEIEENKQEYFYSNIYDYDLISTVILFETDIMEGATYSYNHYFIQQLKIKNANVGLDTFMAKEYLNPDVDYIDGQYSIPLSSGHFTNDDYEIITNYIDLNQCAYYSPNGGLHSYDCSYSGSICLYQKYGYCPYLFKTQKHCRKIRTLNGEKSNRFNLTQELSKVFEIYPNYYTKHLENGKIDLENNKPIKRVFYMTEKGNENNIGFRYECNLSNISRTKDSQEIVTKLYVEDIDSDLSKTGLCSIKNAEDNPSKDSFIIDFSYYTKMGLLDENSTYADLYGNDLQDQGYLKTLGYYNNEYDKLTNKIINLENSSYNELKANLLVNLQGIETSQKELAKIAKQMDKYRTIDNDKSNTYENFVAKYEEQLSILNSLVEETFYTDGECLDPSSTILIPTTDILPSQFLEYDGMTFTKIKEKWVDTHEYTEFGMLGQFCTEYKQINIWKKLREQYLKDINRISLAFFKKYEPFLKEGTWSDSNYIDDNAYYFGAKEVSKQGAIPKVNYSINVVDLSALENFEDFSFEVGDTTYIEDIGMFGINQKTGLPNKLKVIVSEISEDLDEPRNNQINIQNYTTQFEDLFEQVTASVQSLSFNENIYNRSSNFTSTQNIKVDSLQGALNENYFTLLNTSENNINIDENGQAGSDINNHSNKYKLNGQGLFFSNNGGQTWNIGVGPSGINADYIKIGTLDAGKIRIVDNNYLYFLWDKNGIVAYRDPQSIGSDEQYSFNDYSTFNKFGLSLVKDGQIRLRAGYSFAGIDGEAKTEIKTGKEIGFYLFNKQGDVIFKTENDATEEDLTARLSLIGEMYVTDQVSGQEAEGRYKYTSGYQIENQQLLELTPVSSSYEYILCENNIPDSDYVFYYYNTFDNTDDKKILEEIFIFIKNNNIIPDGKYIFITDAADQIRTVFRFENIISPSLVVFGLIEDTLYDNFDTTKLIGKRPYNIVLDLSLAETPTINNFIINNELDISNSIIPIFYQFNGIEYKEYSKVNGRILRSSSEGAIISSSKEVSQEPIIYYKKDGISYIQESKDLYPLNNGNFNYWEEKEYEPGGQTSDSQIGLYMNNTQLNNKEESSSDDKSSAAARLFCCAKNNTNESNVSNIFSILKNGNLYIGGTVVANGGSNTAFKANNVPIEIDVDNPLLAAIDGKIKLSFDNLVDENGNSLSSSLSGDHYHYLQDVGATLVPDVEESSNFLPSKTDVFTITTYNSSGQTTWEMGDLAYIKGNAIAETDVDQKIRKALNGLAQILIELMKNGSTQIGVDSTTVTINFSNGIIGAGHYTIDFDDDATTGHMLGGDGNIYGGYSGYALEDPVNGGN